MTWLLLNWRLVAVLAIVAALGVQTYRLQGAAADYAQLEHRFGVFRLAVESAGKEAARAKREADTRNDLIKGEMENAIQQAQEERAEARWERDEAKDRFGALYGRYMGVLNDPGTGGGAVPQAGDGAAAPLHTGLTICFDRQRFAAGLRRELGALHSEIEPLLRRGEDGLDDRLHWGRWARLQQVCPQP